MVDVHQAAAPLAPRVEPRTRPFDPCEGWEEGDSRLLNGGPRVAAKFPLETLRSLGDWVADLAAAKSAPVDYVVAPFLSLAAGMVGAAREVSPREGWEEPCILWLVGVGNPSSGKSPPLVTMKRSAMALERELAGDMAERLSDYEKAKAESDAVRALWEADVKKRVGAGHDVLSMPEKALEPDKPRPPRLLVADATVEALASLIAQNQHGMSLVRDELSGLLGNFGKYGGSDEPFYLSAYTGDFSKVDRKKGDPIDAARACLSIYGTTQPDKFQEVMEDRADDGLVSRFLPVWPDVSPRLWKVPAADEGRALTIFRRLRSLRPDTDEGGEIMPRVIRLDPGAERIYGKWWEEQGGKANASSGLMAGFLGKSLGTCARLALVLELVDWAVGMNGPTDGPEFVSAHSVELACTLFDDYFEPMARRVYADAALPRNERLAIALLKELRTKKARTFNAREAQRTWGVAGISRASDMDAALAVLREADWVKSPKDLEGDSAPNAGAGRKAKLYHVNPRLFVGGAA